MRKNKDRWSALSMSERADLIKLYVNSGVTSLNDIKKDYNSFGDGGENLNGSSDFKETIGNIIKTPGRFIKGELMDLAQLLQHGIEGAKYKIAYNKQQGYDVQNYFKNEYSDPAQTSFLFSRKEQEKAMLNSGYVKGTPKDYGPLASAIGNEDLPVYQKQKDDPYVGKLKAIFNIDNRFFGKNPLEHAGHFSSTIYVDEEGNLFQKSWDLQNYGNDMYGVGGTQYGNTMQYLANLLDRVGNPSVRTSGLQKLNKQEQKYLLAELHSEALINTILNNSSFGAEFRLESEIMNIRYGEYVDYINSLVKGDKDYHQAISVFDADKIREKYKEKYPFYNYLQTHYPEIANNSEYQRIINNSINLKACGGKINRFNTGGPTDSNDNNDSTIVNNNDNILNSSVVIAPSPQTASFFDDFADRYKKYHGTDVLGVVSEALNDSPIIQDSLSGDARGMYNPLTDKISLTDNSVDNYTHELTHKLNDSFFKKRLRRSRSELRQLKEAYPLGNLDASGLYKVFAGPSEYFTTNTELRRAISGKYGNVLGEELNAVINSISDEELANMAGSRGYSSQGDYYKFINGINTVEDYYNATVKVEPEQEKIIFKNLPKEHKKFWRQAFKTAKKSGKQPSRELDSSKLKKLRKALIEVAQNNNTNTSNIAAFGGKINSFGDGGDTNPTTTIQPFSYTDTILKTAKANARARLNSVEAPKEPLPPNTKVITDSKGNEFLVRSEEPIKDVTSNIMEWTPGIGDVYELGLIGNDFNHGNYGSAALGAGLLFLPGNARKLIDKGKNLLGLNSRKAAKTATEKVKALLKRFPKGMDSPSHFSESLKERLLKEGVDPTLLTDDNLKKMTYLRSQDILESAAPSKFAARESSSGINMYNLYNTVDGNITQVGYINAVPNPQEKSGRIAMVENVTQGSRKPVKGVSELGYNTVIKDLGASENGRILLHPESTVPVLNKYEDKAIIGNYGVWCNNGSQTLGNPVYRLNTPTYDVPIKYLDDFSVEGLDDSGMFLFDFTKGPLFKNGGKLNIFDTGGPIQTALETDLKGSSYFENVLNSIAQTSDQEALKDATEVDHRLNIRFKVPNDTPEAIYVSKVNNLVKEESKEEIIKDLKSKSEDEVKEIQKQLGDEGYYDFELSTGKSNNASTVQKQLVKEGYLTNKDVDSNIGNITTTALQTMLVDKGYLPRYTQDGKDNIDGLLGKRTREAYKQYNRDFNIDGKLGNKTINSFLKSKEKEVKGFDTYVSAEGMVDQCAKWVATKYDTVTGAGKQNGVHGNAWNMLTNIEDAGGKMLFNIYDDAVFDNVSTPSQVKQATQQALKNYNIDYSKLIEGDVVGIYIPSSTHYSDVLKSGTTYNTHVGIIVDIEDGIPIVEHNILGKVRRERIDNLSGSVYGKPTVTVASRPKTGEQVRQLEFKDIKSKYILPEGKENSLMREYMDSLASAKETFKHVFDNVDLDFIEEAAIAITKRETDFMTNKPSDNRFKPSFIATNIVHQLKNTPQDIVSQDLTKMKFNSLNSTYRASIGLSSPEQLSNDPTITGRAVMLLLSKNYDYFTRLAKQNPELGLTKEDIENATILSYNRGIGATHTLGFNKDGSLNIEELKYLRESSKLDAKEKDISSTKLKHLKLLGEKAGQLAEWYYDKYGEPHTPYVSRARQTMLTLRKK